MDNAFEQARRVEAESLEDLLPFLRKHSKHGIVLTDKGRLSRAFQSKYGDVLLNAKTGELLACELKAEKRKTGNLFLEEWSNKKWCTPGWMNTLQCDRLLYHFIDADELYIIDFERLRVFFNEKKNTFRLVEQRKYDQLNQTCGRLAPINDVFRNVGFKIFRPRLEVRSFELLPTGTQLRLGSL